MPGLLGFKPGVAPINVVYSNGSHYDALFYLVGEQEMLRATHLLHEQNTASVGLEGVIRLDEDMDVEVSSAVVPQQPSLTYASGLSQGIFVCN
jgi:hypothetical protein